MAYDLGIDGAPETVPAGSGILVVHPSTVATDDVDTQFLADNDDPVLVVSTHSAAREVGQKLEHYGIDRDRVEILDTISVERGYTRRQRDDVTYLRAPGDLAHGLEHVEAFLAEQDGDARVTVDSVTELIYYADVDQVRETMTDFLDLLDEYEAVGLFHVARDIHEDALGPLREDFRGIVDIDDDGAVHWSE